MERVTFILTLAVLLLLSAPVLRADTEVSDGLYLVAEFQEGNENMWMDVLKFTSEQCVSIAIKGKNTDGVVRKIFVLFYTADDWAKFVDAWKKGRAAPPPASLNDLALGDFLDQDKSMLQLSLRSDGTMLFNAVNKDQNLCMFVLSKDNFKAMDDAVSELAGYFKN
jgi:hypothetical protein